MKMMITEGLVRAGGGIALWYSAIFPEQVEKLVTIDLISFGSLSFQKHVKASREGSPLPLSTFQILLLNYFCNDLCHFVGYHLIVFQFLENGQFNFVL